MTPREEGPRLARIDLPLPSGGLCAIVEGSGASLEAPERLRLLRPSRVAIVSDSNVGALHGPSFAALLRGGGIEAALFTFAAGERSKTRATKEDLEDRLIASGFGRDSAIVALGGGVTCDLAGFVAATYMRGVPIVHVPTSLLAMADAAIGGKTGVDHPAGKNLIGAFHHPAAVLADTEFLRTLPDREFRTGLAEMIKAGIVADSDLFDRMEADAEKLAGRDAAALESSLPGAIRVKAAVVAADEREADLRKILNFGHTVGHALELESGYTLAHGEAISIGMVAEASMAVRLGLLDPGAAGRIDSLLRRVGLPVRLPAEIPPARVVRAAATDKKSRGGRIEFVLPARIGEMGREAGGHARQVPEDVAISCLESLRA